MMTMIPALFTDTLPAAPPEPNRSLQAHDLADPCYDFKLADSIADLDSGAWDRLTESSSFFLRRPYLRALEENRPTALAPRYAVISHDRKPVVALAAQYLDVAGDQVAPPEVKTNRLRNAIRSRLRVRLLICGNIFSWGQHGMAVAARQPSWKLWPAIIEALERIDQAEAPARQADFVVIKDIRNHRTPAPELLHRGFVPLVTQPDMVLDLPAAWAGWGDYLRQLKTRYRRSARRVARRVDAAGCRVESFDAEAISQHGDQLHTLYLQVHETAQIRLARAAASYLPALANIADQRLRCTVIRHADEIVAFVTTLGDGETAFGYHLGFDRQLGARLPLYPRLLQATLTDAIALGCRRLSLGRTALDSKARLGATPVPLAVWLRSRGPGKKLLANALESFGWWDVPARRPFRQSTQAE